MLETHPQTDAKTLADYYTQVYNGGCLALCYLFILMGGAVASEEELLNAVIDLLKDGTLGRDCFVKDFGKIDDYVQSLLPQEVRAKHKIEWRATKEEVEGLSIAKYKADSCREGHWVVLKDGKVYFNPLKKSINVDEGKIIEQRVITA